MKKSITVLSLFFWAFTTILLARTPEEAAQIASQFFASQEHTSIPSAQRASIQSGTTLPEQLAFTQYTADATEPALYVFNHTDMGFVIISAEDDGPEVLGYSHHNTFDPTNVPANLSFWLQTYADDIADYRASVQAPAAQLARLQGRQAVPPAPASAFTPVEPILGDVQWGQGTPYNDLAPTINDTKTPAGCVATALAQIMYTHKYPTKGQGEYTYRLGDLTISANFGATTYDWKNMLPQYRAGQYNTTQQEAIATLMYHVGVASNMYFGPSGSGAVSITAMEGLIRYFNYDPAIETYLKDYVGTTDLLSKIADELLEGRAIYMSGATVNNEGHAFVCDGINETGFLHINWGWDGSYDGYYALFALNPAEHGTGGSTSNLAFTEGVDVWLGIQPNKGGKQQPMMTADSYSVSKTSFSTNSAFSITLQQISNFGLGKANGSVYIVAYDQNGKVCDEVKTSSVYLDSYNMYKTYTFNAYNGLNLPDGDYQLAVELRQNDAVYPIYLLHCGAMRLPMQVSNGNIQLDEIQAEEDIEHFHSINIYNQNQTNRWIIDACSQNYHGTVVNGQSLGATIYSDNPNSIIGSYVLDPTNSGKPGTIASDAFYAMGNSQSNTHIDLHNMHITISPDANGSLLLQLYIDTKQIGPLQSSITLQPQWYIFDGTNTLPYDEQISYQVAASLSIYQAIDICAALPTTEPSDMRYYVSGRIAEMESTPAQIVASQKASFRFSELGTPFNVVYAQQIAPLDDRYTTGTELQQGYSITIYGQLKKGNEPIILGQLTAITPGEYIDYSVTSLRLISLEGTKVTVAWETLAPQVEISIYNSKRKLLGRRFMTEKQISFTAPEEDHYTIYVQPADMQENYLDYEAEITVDVILTDYSIKNLQVNITDQKMLATWESLAKHFHVVIYNHQGNIMSEKIIATNQFTANLPFGEYQLWLRPIDETEHFYLAEAITHDFIIADPTDVHNLPYPDQRPSASSIKRIYKGQLIIIRDGCTYNILGQKL